MDYLLELIDKSKHRIDYKNPDLTILLEISNDLLCLTVVKNYYMYRMYNLFALSKSDEELKQEKEKLMNYQIMAEERKKLNNNDKSDGLKKDKENDNHIEKINNNKIDENNNLKDLDLPLNESDNIYIFKDEDEDKYKDKDNNILNRSNNEEDENSDIDLI